MIAIKRAYEPPAGGDGTRFLVERLWPRGLTKAALDVEAWLKDVAPSTELRQWFKHDPAKWDEFRRRYRRELDGHPEAWRPIAAAAQHGPVTLVYSARDAAHNNAAALQQYLAPKLRRSANGTHGEPARRSVRGARRRAVSSTRRR